MTLVQTEPKKIYIRVDQQQRGPGANTIAFCANGNYHTITKYTL